MISQSPDERPSATEALVILKSDVPSVEPPPNVGKRCRSAYDDGDDGRETKNKRTRAVPDERHSAVEALVLLESGVPSVEPPSNAGKRCRSAYDDGIDGGREGNKRARAALGEQVFNSVNV